jgi:hypothetical protein
MHIILTKSGKTFITNKRNLKKIAAVLNINDELVVKCYKSKDFEVRSPELTNTIDILFYDELDNEQNLMKMARKYGFIIAD